MAGVAGTDPNEPLRRGWLLRVLRERLVEVSRALVRMGRRGWPL